MKHILAYCDSLCEPNPGAMEGGIWAVDEKDNVLFMDNIYMGDGTCNEAEYRALLALIVKLKHTTEEKGVLQAVLDKQLTITVHSDSQLMTKQLYIKKSPTDKTRIWKVSKPSIKALHNKVRQFQEAFPFQIKWIPREQNSVADGLAQTNRLKGSGRQHMMEDGRFKAKRYTPCVELLSDKQMAKLLYSNELVAGRDRLLVLIRRSDPYYPHLVTELQIMLSNHEACLKKYPQINNLASQWIGATYSLLKQNLEEMLCLAQDRDESVLNKIDDFFYNLKAPLTQEGEEFHAEESEILALDTPEPDYDEELQEYIDSDNRY